MKLRCLTIALALVAAFASDSWGQSSEPPASANPPSKQNAQPPTPDERGTVQLPLAVKILPAPDAEMQAEKQEREGREKAETDRVVAMETRRIADYTWWLAALTAALICVAVMQAGLFWVQLRYMHEDAKTSKATLISSFRPKLRVRNIVVNPPSDAVGRKFPLFQQGHRVDGQLFVVNIGGSAAKILDSYCGVWWNRPGSSYELPMRRPYEGKDGNFALSKTSLAAGESTTGLFNSEGLVSASILGIDTILSSRAYVMGWIEYADDLGLKRRTTFCRQYKSTAAGADGRFYPVSDPDYEHEE
jgi:hypothetical protein